MNRLSAVAPLAAALLGGWLTVPFAFVALFELDGFGTDRDGPARLVVVLGCGLACLCCAVVPLVLAQWLAPRVLGWTLVTYAAGLAGAVVVTGSSARPRPVACDGDIPA